MKTKKDQPSGWSLDVKIIERFNLKLKISKF